MFILYDNIKSLCEKRGVSVSKMCEQAEISKSTLSNLRNGRSETITPATAKKIAAFLNVSVDDVMHGANRELPFIASDRHVDFDLGKLGITDDDINPLSDFEWSIIELYRNSPEAKAQIDLAVELAKRKAAQTDG